MRFLIVTICVLVLCPSHEAISIGNDDSTNVNEHFLKTLSHHYCDRLTGAHVVLLAEKSAASFYKVLLR